MPARHTNKICKMMEKVERGEVTRLMIFLPPRHSKSMTVSETFPSFFIGKNPERRVIEASYGDSLAKRFGSENKRIIDEFGNELFGIMTDQSNASKVDWSIEGHRGGMISAGIMGGITGQGADLLIIDDPIKNRAEADSPAYRKALLDEWQNSLLTRLHPGGRVVIILTRWHEKDLAGELLARQGAAVDGGIWDVLNMPAIAEKPKMAKDGSRHVILPDSLEREAGEPLWPEHGYDLEWARKTKEAVGSFVWSALYQQRPTPDDMTFMFRREWFDIVDDYPKNAHGCRYWDLAATKAKKGKDPDWTAGGYVVEKDGEYWIVDVKKTRQTPQKVQQLIRQTAELDGKSVPIYMEQEPGSSGVNTIDNYRRNVLKGFPFYADKVGDSKAVRAQPLSAAAEAGNVHVVRGGWNADFLDEISIFNTGMEDHDDQVDCVTGAFNKLNSNAAVDALPAVVSATSYWR